MLPGGLAKKMDARRLKTVLAIIFAVLAVPTAVLIWQGYNQLQWESFHQNRSLAEEFTRRVDEQARAWIAASDERSFADYGFLVLTGEPSANFVQRSPLSAFPVDHSIPGVLGHFQVSADGTFSTPLLPPAGADFASLGIAPAEVMARTELAEELHRVLAENQLVKTRSSVSRSRVLTPDVAESRAILEKEEADIARDEIAELQATSSLPESQAPTAPVAAGTANLQRNTDGPEVTGDYDQSVFDRLNQRYADLDTGSSQLSADSSPAENVAAADVEAAAERAQKLSDIRLDEEMEAKSQAMAGGFDVNMAPAPAASSDVARQKRREQIALPDAAGLGSGTGAAFASERISTFESEVDPLAFSLLDNDHFVFFRNVWRDNQRTVQGLVVNQKQFLEDAIERPFRNTALSNMANIIVAQNDNVILTSVGGETYRDFVRPGELDGSLLYRSRLAAPLDQLELIFSVRSLPVGPGGKVLAWVTLILAMVFIGGFTLLYRLGLGQIRLAQQQQDFVSAVSHELKTPLTSIRMYGEMLKEGWADESKRQDYYDYIHDESERLTRMISNVLQLASISRSDPQLEFKRVTVAELMTNIASKIASQVERAGFRLEFDRQETADDTTLSLDEDCFSQIVINLVDNAIKFSKSAANKTVRISSAARTDGAIEFSIRDYGPGIPEDQMKNIFKMFYRTENELTRETVGTGIGLAIVHQLTTAMQGKIDVRNVSPGAEFKITFPAS